MSMCCFGRSGRLKRSVKLGFEALIERCAPMSFLQRVRLVECPTGVIMHTAPSVVATLSAIALRVLSSQLMVATPSSPSPCTLSMVAPR